MGKINGCLKCLFVFFNVLFAIIGCVFIYVTVKATAYSVQMSAVSGVGLGWMWVFALGVLCTSCLGIFAGCSENGLALKIFAGLMAMGMVVMLIFGIIVAVIRNNLKSNFESASAGVAEPFMEEQSLRDILESLQASVHCCGVVGAQDWAGNIPASCECKPSNQDIGLYGVNNKCTAKPRGTTGPDLIWEQPCSNIIFSWMDLAFKIVMGILFGCAVTALMGLLISILMAHQVKRHDNPATSSIAMKGY